MALSSKMKNLSDEILAAFKQRIKENEELVKDVQKTLDGFHKDHQEMAASLNNNAKALREGLSQGEKERLSNYNNLMDGIHGTISSLQQEVADIQTSTANMISDFTEGRVQMANELDQIFAQNRTERKEGEKARMAEFKSLMKDINGDIKHINEEIKHINEEVASIFENTNEMLATFDKEHLEMSDELKAELGRNLTERVAYTQTMLSGFQTKLAEISKENQETAEKLQKDLANGETERLRDYNGIMKQIHSDIKGIQKEVKEVRKTTSDTLGNYANERKKAVDEWNKMQATMAEIRKTGMVEQPDVVEKKEEKAKTVTEPVVEAPVEVEPKEEVKPQKEVKPKEEVKPQKEAKPKEEVKPQKEAKPKEEVKPTEKSKPEVSMTLKEKVLDYINKHPKGVKISEMEKPLGETRMKLGFIAKALLEEGKVQKLENVYFPIK